MLMKRESMWAKDTRSGTHIPNMCLSLNKWVVVVRHGNQSIDN